MVGRRQILHVARLAKLALSAEEEGRLVAQVGEILRYVDQLRAIGERVSAEPGQTAPAHAPPLRADEPRPGLARDEVLALAPCSDGETVQVPAVLEGGGEA